MSKHTPGPWRIDNYDHTMIWGGEDQPCGGMRICDLRGFQDGANARLIAAAPDLLEALENQICHSCMNRIGFKGDFVRDGSIPERFDWRKCAACVIPRAVIAKATGAPK